MKHRGSSTSVPEVQQLLGANPIDANSIFVSTGGFTSAAISVARQNGVRLIDLSELVNLILTWYESMPNETKIAASSQKGLCADVSLWKGWCQSGSDIQEAKIGSVAQ